MVANNLTDTPAFLAVMVRRRPFFQENLFTELLTLELKIMPSDKVEVEPCFVLAALIIRVQAQDIAVNREGTMKPYPPLSIGFRRFKKITHVSPAARNRSGSPQRCGAGRHRQSAVSNGSMMLKFLLFSRRRAAPWKSSATRSSFSSSITARTARMGFFQMPRSLA